LFFLIILNSRFFHSRNVDASFENAENAALFFSCNEKSFSTPSSKNQTPFKSPPRRVSRRFCRYIIYETAAAPRAFRKISTRPLLIPASGRYNKGKFDAGRAVLFAAAPPII